MTKQTKTKTEKPQVAGFHIPNEPIDFGDDAKRKTAIGIYRSFLVTLLSRHNRDKGYVYWCLGTTLNRLKPIKGKGKKEIEHGEWAKLLRDIDVSEDTAERVRWAAVATTTEDDAKKMGWKALREAGETARAKKNGKGDVKGSKPKPKGKPKLKPMTPEKYETSFSALNLDLKAKLDSGWEWGAGTPAATVASLENAINRIHDISGKCDTFLAMLTEKKKEAEAQATAEAKTGKKTKTATKKVA